MKPTFTDYSGSLLIYFIRKRHERVDFQTACIKIGKTPDLVRRILSERKVCLQLGMI